MCGIAGWLGRVPDREKVAQRLGHSLRHRGPDSQGIRHFADASLVHSRLSIIDLTGTGAQPMSNEDGTVWTIFNGEIYNHRELRRDLESRGHQFFGQSDAEVIPHLYEEYGDALAGKLRGMFAIGVYDTNKKMLLLVRDRFGIKPLFYSKCNDQLFFASELNALLHIEEIDTHPDLQAIHDFVALFYIPAPETFYRGVRCLEPGTMLTATIDGNTIRCWNQRYHSWRVAPDLELTLSQATEDTACLLVKAVRSQLQSDVPLGALLSGGIDSSLVSAAAQRSLDSRLRTFNVRFQDEAYDETWAAEAVAGHIGSDHQVLEMDRNSANWENVIGLLNHAGQPFADTSIFASSAICQLMRRNVTVALSGDGGDEAYGGYTIYRQLSRIAPFQRMPEGLQAGAHKLCRFLSTMRLVAEDLPRAMDYFLGADDVRTIQNLFCWIRPEEHRLLWKGGDVLPVRRLFSSEWQNEMPRRDSRIERLFAHATEINVRLSLPNDFLFKVDTASMKHGLEIRVPLLDEDVFAFGLRLPWRLKVRGGTGKRVLRNLAAEWLPPAIANKPKRGFEIPFDSWVDREFKECLRTNLLGPQSLLPEFLDPAVYQPFVLAFCQNQRCPGVSRAGLYQRVIMLLSLQLALQKSPLQQV